MEKDRSRTGQVGSSRGVLRSLSLSPPSFLNYRSSDLRTPEVDMMMTASSSSQNDLLMMGLDRHQSLVDYSRGVLRSSLVPPPPPLNHRSKDLRMPEVDMMMTASSSRQNNLLMELHRHQSLVDHHNEALFQLDETAKQARDLQEENFNLKTINADLSNRLALLLKVTSDHAASFGYSGMGMDPNMNLNAAMTGLGMMNLASDSKQGPPNWDNLDVEGGSPNATGMIDTGQIQESEESLVDRVSLPKSISVRSDNYLKTVQRVGSRASRVNNILKRSKSSGKQKVYLPGEENVDKPLAVEVYNQGMSKTEICNKWQETGACPYEKQCQFAHGLEELRPVLRHPRYKTEVCRMVLNGDSCNYGHRCHFRHALTDKENLMKAINLRSPKGSN